MNLLGGQPFWLYKNGTIDSYPVLDRSIQTDVTIIGGGITGALLAWHLTEAGLPPVVIEKRHIALGSTSGSTALLQYEIDTHLTRLIQLVGEKHAVRSYELCVEAIYKVKDLAANLPLPVDFSLCESIYYASRKKDLPDLEKECNERKKHGIAVEWWDESQLRNNFPHLKKSGAILSHDAGQIDPFKFTHSLLNASIQKGAQVYDTVEVTEIIHEKNGVLLKLSNHTEIKTRKLIIACGYESQNYITKNCIRLHSSYALVSKPIDRKELWYKNALLWESARPYLYMRVTPDQRLLIGGKDVPFQSAGKRDRLLKRKTAQLAHAARQLFPDLPVAIDYSWCGTFAETEDGLPFIGSIAEHPHTYFALGFGGNGILFSVIAAEIIRDVIQGKKNTDSTIFRFDRV